MKRKDADGTPLFDIVRDAATAPQARHHFRMLDQVDALVEARESGPDVGFMARLLALCALPRTNGSGADRIVGAIRPGVCRSDADYAAMT